MKSLLYVWNVQKLLGQAYYRSVYDDAKHAFYLAGYYGNDRFIESV